MAHHEEENHLPLFKSPLVSNAYRAPSSAPSSHEEHEVKEVPPPVAEADDSSLLGNPHFRRHAEATNSELFYDLFFVANLTVFTAVHEVNDGTSLQQYIGFFSVLWFTWYQVGLYDVRFAMDSAFERVVKTAHFLVMIAFAIVGPKFAVGETVTKDTDDDKKPKIVYFKALTLTLMVSRLVLVCQYLQSMYFTSHYKKTKTPMAIIATTYFVAAIIYLGLYWSFDPKADGKNHSYIAWYVVAILETIIAIWVSSYWRTISFKGSHLVQRMSLLTLIILGEGVMTLAKKCQSLVKSPETLGFAPSTIANIFCAVLILYFLYQLYFDWMQEEHFGTIRQQVWSFLHFPLHLALVLAVEAIGQCVSWRAAVVRWNKYETESDPWFVPFWDDSTPTAAEYANIGNEALTELQTLASEALAASGSIDQTLDYLGYFANIDSANATIANGTENFNASANALSWTYLTTIKSIFNVAGFVAPESQSSGSESDNLTIDFNSDDSLTKGSQDVDSVFGVFELTYVYFFITMGMVVILCTLIAALSKKQKARYHWIRLIASSLIGLGIVLLSLTDLTDAVTNLALSPWLLPLITILLFIVVLLNNVKPALPEISRTRSHA